VKEKDRLGERGGEEGLSFSGSLDVTFKVAGGECGGNDI
jgi:hypothetical protein